MFEYKLHDIKLFLEVNVRNAQQSSKYESNYNLKVIN